MTKVRAAFYKGQFGNIFDMAIMARTLSKYSHVELGMFIDGEWHYFSSTSRADFMGKTGPRWIDEKELLRNPHKWDVVEFESPLTIDQMLENAASTIGGKYDWWGLVGFIVIGTPFNSKKNWYCSEACHFVAFSQWVKQISPGDFWRKIYSFITRILTEEEYVNKEVKEEVNSCT